MKIKLEGYFSDLDLELQEAGVIDQASYNNNVCYKQKFYDYVNHSRSPYSINSEGVFTGSCKTLRSFARSFEKTNPGVTIVTDTRYSEGEQIPFVHKVIYNGGDK